MIKAHPDAMWHLIPFQKRLTRRRVFEEVIIALNTQQGGWITSLPQTGLKGDNLIRGKAMSRVTRISLQERSM